MHREQDAVARLAVVYIGKEFKQDSSRLIWTEETHQIGRTFTNRAHAILQTVHRDCFGNSGWPGPVLC